MLFAVRTGELHCYVETGHDLLLPNPGLVTVPSVHCTVWSVTQRFDITEGIASEFVM
jgi:hypothetical protein